MGWYNSGIHTYGPSTRYALMRVAPARAWNVALFPGGERAQRLRELSTTLPAEARTDFLALIREMIARKERDFAQNTRYILIA